MYTDFNTVFHCYNKKCMSHKNIKLTHCYHCVFCISCLLNLLPAFLLVMVVSEFCLNIYDINVKNCSLTKC